MSGAGCVGEVGCFAGVGCLGGVGCWGGMVSGWGCGWCGWVAVSKRDLVESG